MIIGRRDFLLAVGSHGSMMAVLQENPLQPALDFEKSRIVWKTRTGTSGYWRVAAAIRRLGSNDYTVLAPTVMAGHIFQEGRLAILPPYLFQLIASRNRHWIVREGSPHAQDSEAANDSVFREFRIDLSRYRAKPVDLTHFEDHRVTEWWPMTASINIAAANEDRWIIDFPVNHLNLSDNAKSAFQIETGPILFPCDAVEIKGATRYQNFWLCFMFMNKADRADLLAWGDSPNGTGRSFCHLGHVAGLSTSIWTRD